MNVIMISPHFPPNYDLFSVHLANQGANVLGIADIDRKDLSPRLQAALGDYYRVDDLNQEWQVHEAIRYFIDRHGDIHRLESHNDHWLDMDAGMRSCYGIPGPKSEDILWMRKKSLMKAGFDKAGIRTAEWRMATTLDDAISWAEKTGYPIVIKPDSGVGATNTFCIKDQKELEDFFHKKPSGEYIMEQFINGMILTFDGLTDADGRILFFSSLRYSTGMMESVNELLDVFFYTLRDIPPDLEEAGRKVVEVFDIRERFFHIEFFKTLDKGDIVALEINARPPGGPILDVYDHASETDLYLKWAQAVLGRPEMPEKIARPWHCGYMGRRNNRSYLYSHDEVVEKFGHMMIHHEPVQSIFRVAMADHYYIMRSRSLDDIKGAADLVFARAE